MQAVLNWLGDMPDTRVSDLGTSGDMVKIFSWLLAGIQDLARSWDMDLVMLFEFIVICMFRNWVWRYNG